MLFIRKNCLWIFCAEYSETDREISACWAVILMRSIEGIGMAGLLTENAEWIDTAVCILNYEIPRQNYPNGVNKEMSLRYQSFFMEAVGLLSLTMKQCGRQIPERTFIISIWRAGMLTAGRKIIIR